MLPYLASLLIFGGIYAILGLGLNLQWGHTGFVNLGFVAFFAIGAYTSALLTQNGLPLVIAPVASVLVTGLLAYPIGRLTLRLEDNYLAIVTFGFAQIVQVIIINSGWAGGAAGITGLSQWFQNATGDTQLYLQLALVGTLVVLLFLLMWRLTESPYGRVLRAIRDNSPAARSLGKDVSHYRLATLLIGSALAGGAGSLYAHYIGYISHDQFSSDLGFMIFTGIIVGGSAHLGAASGTLVFVGIMEASRFLSDLDLPITDAQLAQLRLLIVGVLLVMLMQRRPQGLWPYRHRRRVARG